MTMSKKIILHESLPSIADAVERPSKIRKIWNRPAITLLEQVDIQSGDGSGNEADNLGFWQSGLGS
jgi:hypothetical protein